MAKKDIWMPLYISDYLKDTGRLNTLGHGAYLLMIMDYWVNGALLDDDEELAAITRLSIKEWKALKPKMQRFFEVKEGFWYHKRIEKEKQNTIQISGVRSNSGKLGAKIRWGNRKQSDDENIANAIDLPIKEIANDKQTASQNDAHSHSHKTSNYLNNTEDLTIEESVHDPGVVSTNHKKSMPMTPKREANIAFLLQKHGVKSGCMRPEVIDWANKNVSDDMILAALNEAKQSLNGNVPSGSAYLAPIVEKLLNPREKINGKSKSKKFNFAEHCIRELRSSSHVAEASSDTVYESLRGEVYEHGQ